MVAQVPLYPHQKKAVAELANGKILAADVGLGKSRTAAAYYMKEEAPRDVYVITTAKKRDSKDWVGEFAQFGVGTARDATVAGVLTVDSWNNIGKYEGVANAFFVLDEQRLVGSGAWTKSFYKIARANHWILLSATPGDVWLDYVPVFVANGFYKNATDFKRQHVVYSYYGKFPKVERYIGEWRLKKLRDSILVHVPYPRHTVRHTHVIETCYDKSLMERVLKKRWHVYETRPLRDVAELYSVARKVVNSDSSRLEAVKCLMEKHPKLIVFYNFDYELDALRTLADGHFASLSRTERSGSSSSTSTTTSVDGAASTESSTTSSIPTATRTSRSSEATPDRSLPYGQPLGVSHPPWPDDETSGRNDLLVETLRPTSSTSSTSSTSTRLPLTSLPGRSGSSSTRSVEGSSTSSTLEGDSGTSSSAVVNESSETWNSQRTGKASNTKPNSPNTFSAGTDTTVSTDGGTDPTLSQTSPDQAVPAQDVSPGFTVAEWNGKKHQPIPETDRWVYLVQYQAGAEGWNCITTNAIVFYSLTYSYKNWHQAHGRIDRLNTGFTNLHYYVLKSQSWVDNAVWKALRAKKSFNEPKHRFDS